MVNQTLMFYKFNVKKGKNKGVKEKYKLLSILHKNILQ
jgi:hypothetical protein